MTHGVELQNCPFCGMNDIKTERTVSEQACWCGNCGAKIVRDADDLQTPEMVWNARSEAGWPIAKLPTSPSQPDDSCPRCHHAASVAERSRDEFIGHTGERHLEWECSECGFLMTQSEIIHLAIDQLCPRCEKVHISNFVGKPIKTENSNG